MKWYIENNSQEKKMHNEYPTNEMLNVLYKSKNGTLLPSLGKHQKFQNSQKNPTTNPPINKENGNCQSLSPMLLMIEGCFLI